MPRKDIVRIFKIYMTQDMKSKDKEKRMMDLFAGAAKGILSKGISLEILTERPQLTCKILTFWERKWIEQILNKLIGLEVILLKYLISKSKASQTQAVPSKTLVSLKNIKKISILM